MLLKGVHSVSKILFDCQPLLTDDVTSFCELKMKDYFSISVKQQNDSLKRSIHSILSIFHQVKISVNLFGMKTYFSPLGGVTLDSGVDDLGKAISAFEGLDGSFIDKLMDLDQIKVDHVEEVPICFALNSTSR